MKDFLNDHQNYWLHSLWRHSKNGTGIFSVKMSQESQPCASHLIPCTPVYVLLKDNTGPLPVQRDVKCSLKVPAVCVILALVPSALWLLRQWHNLTRKAEADEQSAWAWTQPFTSWLRWSMANSRREGSRHDVMGFEEPVSSPSSCPFILPTVPKTHPPQIFPLPFWASGSYPIPGTQWLFNIYWTGGYLKVNLHLSVKLHHFYILDDERKWKHEALQPWQQDLLSSNLSSQPWERERR